MADTTTHAAVDTPVAVVQEFLDALARPTSTPPWPWSTTRSSTRTSPLPAMHGPVRVRRFLAGIEESGRATIEQLVVGPAPVPAPLRSSYASAKARWVGSNADGMRSAERQEGLRTSGCADRWLVVDSRPRRWHDGPVVDEADAEAFLRLRPQVESFGVELVDVVIFDDQCHWWSLHELTTGTASWTPQPMRLAS